MCTGERRIVSSLITQEYRSKKFHSDQKTPGVLEAEQRDGICMGLLGYASNSRIHKDLASYWAQFKRHHMADGLERERVSFSTAQTPNLQETLRLGGSRHAQDNTYEAKIATSGDSSADTNRRPFGWLANLSKPFRMETSPNAALVGQGDNPEMATFGSVVGVSAVSDHFWVTSKENLKYSCDKKATSYLIFLHKEKEKWHEPSEVRLL